MIVFDIVEVWSCGQKMSKIKPGCWLSGLRRRWTLSRGRAGAGGAAAVWKVVGHVAVASRGGTAAGRLKHVRHAAAAAGVAEAAAKTPGWGEVRS